jgi:hypothetical protein
MLIRSCPLVLLIMLTAFFQSNAQTAYKDIAPILYNNCTACHHSGGIGFPLTSYSEVYAMGGAMSAAVTSGEMPPWPADPTYKHYVKERVMSPTDKAALLDWLNNGMLAGDTTLAPPVPTYGAYQLYGTPDLILNVPTVTSTATTADHYYCINVPVNITQNRYIRAFEYVPGNAEMIHHSVMTIDTFGTAVDDLSGSCYNFQGQVGIGDYAPGMGPTVLPGTAPAKFGFPLKMGSKISFQMHVPAGTAGQTDNSQLRLYFYPVTETGIRPMLFETALQNWNFVVPPNSVITATAKYPPGSAGMPVPVSLYSTFPHSHQTCTAITNFGYKGADTIPLIRIPKWEFHWQMQYIFPKMVKLPATYHLFASHVFDNTVNNPETPDPNSPVVAGTNTADEMLFDSYLYSLYQTGDELIDIESLILNDPLFAPTGLENHSMLQSMKVVPNPMTSFFEVQYALASTQMVQLKIVDLFGKVVYQRNMGIQQPGQHSVQQDVQALGMVTGNYALILQAGRDRTSSLITIQ